MKIWKIKCDMREEYQSYQLVNREKSYFREFCDKTEDGVRLNGEYDNAEVENADGEKSTDIAYLWAGGNFVLTNEKARNCLEDLLEDSVEYVPLKCENTTLYMLNILSLIEATDHEKCILRKSASGLEVGYETYVFIQERIQGKHFFRILFKGYACSTETFVSTEFKERVEQNQLTGVKFIEVWDSDSM